MAQGNDAFDDSEDLPPLCGAQVNRGTITDPPDYCENDAEPGSEFCGLHDPDREDPRIQRLEDYRDDVARGLYDDDFEQRSGL